MLFDELATSCTRYLALRASKNFCKGHRSKLDKEHLEQCRTEIVRGLKGGDGKGVVVGGGFGNRWNAKNMSTLIEKLLTSKLMFKKEFLVELMMV